MPPAKRQTNRLKRQPRYQFSFGSALRLFSKPKKSTMSKPHKHGGSRCRRCGQDQPEKGASRSSKHLWCAFCGTVIHSRKNSSSHHHLPPLPEQEEGPVRALRLQRSDTIKAQQKKKNKIEDSRKPFKLFGNKSRSSSEKSSSNISQQKKLSKGDSRSASPKSTKSSRTSRTIQVKSDAPLRSDGKVENAPIYAYYEHLVNGGQRHPEDRKWFAEEELNELVGRLEQMQGMNHMQYWGNVRAQLREDNDDLGSDVGEHVNLRQKYLRPQSNLSFTNWQVRISGISF